MSGYRFAINQVYSGSFLSDNLGHELINFLVDNEGKRYIYLMSLGEINEEADKKLEYVFHVMRTKAFGQDCYELIAVSKVKKNASNRASYCGNQEERSPILRFKKKRLSFFEIFDMEGDDCKVYSLEAESLWRPKKGKRILFFKKKSSSSFSDEENVIKVSLKCNWIHLMAYAASEDEKVLEDLLGKEYLEEDGTELNFDKIDDELCFATIGDRTRLEDSLSNELAYFLSRDPSLMKTFITNFLNLNVDPDEEFKVTREKEKRIDLFFKSNKQVIVVENKIDARLSKNQLSKYWDHVEKTYPTLRKSYFVLTPPNHPLTPETLKQYGRGDKYELLHYDGLQAIFEDADYRPDSHKPSPYSEFLFGELVKSIEFLARSEAESKRSIALTRLKQRCRFLVARKQP